MATNSKISNAPWSNASGWSLSRVPISTDAVDLAGYTVSLDMTAQGASLTDSIGTGRLQVSAPQSILIPSLTASSGQLVGVTIIAGLTWIGGTLNTSGSGTIGFGLGFGSSLTIQNASTINASTGSVGIQSPSGSSVIQQSSITLTQDSTSQAIGSASTYLPAPAYVATGQPYGIGDTTTGGTPTGAPAGFYSNYAGMVSLYGSNNITQWSNDDGSNTPNFGKIQAALNYADSEINGFFWNGPYIVPISAGTSSATTAYWGSVIAAIVFLFRSRWGVDTASKVYDYSEDVQRVYADMGLYKGGMKFLNAPRRWPTPTSPVGVNQFGQSPIGGGPVYVSGGKGNSWGR